MVQRQLFPGERERGVRNASREARHSFVPKTYGGGPNGVPLLTISDAMKVTLYEFCLLHHQEELLEQWDPANLPATPQNVTYGTRDEYWWQCEKGHRWQAPVKSRTSGRGCPYCSTRRLQPGVNDFATRFPDIAAQWHPTKNGAFQPDQVAPGSHRKAWWRCEAGHEWQASVTSRTSGGSGCPVCAGRLVLPGVNDFASAFPALAAQWHPTKNNSLRPEQVAANSNRSVWWQCEQGHTWRAPVGRRVQFATGCPYCTGRKVLPGFNDLASLEPQVAAQWDTERNGSLRPDQVTVGSGKRVWWRCEEGHVWKAKVYSRTGKMRTGCPVCAGVAKTNFTHRYHVLVGEPSEATLRK